jgi:hypothetical protein
MHCHLQEGLILITISSLQVSAYPLSICLLITNVSLQNLQILPHYVSHNMLFQTETRVHTNEGFVEKCFPAESIDYFLEIVLHVTCMLVCSAVMYTN